MRWLAALLAGNCLASAAFADSGEDAPALALELVDQTAQVGGLSVDDPDALVARLEEAMRLFEREADEREVQWSASYGIDVDASSVARSDAEGNPMPADAQTLEDDERMPAPGAGCDTPESHPVSATSTAPASWDVCIGIENDGDGPYYMGFSELLFGEGGNYRRVRLGVAVTSPDTAYIDAMSGTATQMLYDMMDSIRADAIAP